AADRLRSRVHMQTLTTHTRVVIIGGGISGLSAAWFLQQAGIDYTLLEASARLGGKVLTEHVGDFVIEAGGGGFFSKKTSPLQPPYQPPPPFLPLDPPRPATAVVQPVPPPPPP